MATPDDSSDNLRAYHRLEANTVIEQAEYSQLEAFQEYVTEVWISVRCHFQIN